MVGHNLYLFGDQTFEIQKLLPGLLDGHDNERLQQFLDRTYSILRGLIHDLPSQERSRLPDFSCIDDIVQWKHQGNHFVPLDMATTCIYQLGTFIRDSSDQWPCQKNDRILGLCTGALSAAAISCSRNANDIAVLGAECVAMAFRVGRLVDENASQIEARGPASTYESWSMFVGGSRAAEEVARFNEASLNPNTRQLYLSAQMPNGVSVSAPPSTLAAFQASDGFQDLKARRIPIYGPYHAPHLYFESDLTRLLNSVSRSLTTRSQQITLIRGDGIPSTGSDFMSALEEALQQILLCPIDWLRLVASLKTWLPRSFENSQSKPCLRLHTFGTSTDQVIYAALKDQCQVEISSRYQKTASINTEEGSSSLQKLAIVAMAGRFPGASGTDEFWNVLHRGLDMHKTVPDLHWDAASHVDTTGKRKNTSATPYGCWLDEPADFDSR